VGKKYMKTKKIFNTYLDCNIKTNNFPSLKNPFHDEKIEKKIK